MVHIKPDCQSNNISYTILSINLRQYHYAIHIIIFAKKIQKKMKLLVDRKWKKEGYTIGKLYLDGLPFCETLEDKDRGLTSVMTPEQIKAIKKSAMTAIPTGTYKIRMNVISSKYSKKDWYVRNCHQSRLPRLENVPGFDGILIHPGNTADNTEGCILVGKNSVKGMVTNSKEIFLQLYNKMYIAYKQGEEILITIK